MGIISATPQPKTGKRSRLTSRFRVWLLAEIGASGQFLPLFSTTREWLDKDKKQKQGRATQTRQEACRH